MKVKDQIKRFEGFLSRLWIPTTPEEQETYDGVAKSLVPYTESLMKQVARGEQDEILEAFREAHPHKEAVNTLTAIMQSRRNGK